MAKKWYVVHTYSGSEQKAKAALEERVKALGKEQYFGEVLVPAEKVKKAKAILNRANERFHIIGRIVRGERKVSYN